MSNSENTKSFKDLVVWQKAHALVLEVYKLTEKFPKHELFGLTSQIRRSAVSVAANIAEGYKKKSDLDKARFLNMSQGSAQETLYYLILANDLGYSETSGLQIKLEEINKMLYAYIKAMNKL